MKKGIIVNLRHFKIFDYVVKNKIFLGLCALFVAGIALGSVLILKNTWLSQNTQKFFISFFQLHISKTFLNKFFSCLLRYIIVLVIYFLSGASMLGVAVTPFITVWQGIFIGCLMSYLCAAFGINGIAFNAVIFIPPLSIFSVCCFFAAKYAIEFSLSIAKLTIPKSRPLNLYETFKRYCGKYLIFVGIAVICSLIEIILNLIFLKYFNF